MRASQQQAIFSLDAVHQAAEQILQGNPDPIPAYRLQKDVLRLPSNNKDLRKTHTAIEHSRWVEQLKGAQLPDGSWGRFHSQDTKVKTAFRTSEEAIDRALSLGLQPDHPVLRSAKGYIENVLRGKAHITDRDEKNDAWPVLIKIILAGKLAEIDPTNPALIQYWEYMVEIAQQAFSSGDFQLEDEIEAYQRLSGIHVWRGFLQSRYAISLLSARKLPKQLEQFLLEWIWNKPDGMSYLQVPLRTPVPRSMAYWLRSMNILHHFSYWREVSVNTLNKLWEERDREGWWDFGRQSTMCADFPISEDWRRPQNRKVDYSTCMLVVMRRFFD